MNLAGISDVDYVQRNPESTRTVNVFLPSWLAQWCDAHCRRLLHVSSQAVFSGANPPYGAYSARVPINEYGRQKALAEDEVLDHDGVILRATFILGMRPLPHVGRQNPLELMINARQKQQVNDRYFSPLLAWDAARLIWEAAQTAGPGQVRQLGMPCERGFSRYEIATAISGFGANFEAVSHDSFFAAAPRPLNTRYADSLHHHGLLDGVMDALKTSTEDRAIELALFFGTPLEKARQQLSQGFGPLHVAVTEDFHMARASMNDHQLLAWYRATEAYIWELSAYHEDPGFNYAGMCQGIAERLKAAAARRVLCLGDGIGDLTLALERAGLHPVYHDLEASRTAQYAQFRIWRQTGHLPAVHLSKDWRVPEFIAPYDAVVSLDFLEHVVNVDEWAAAIHAALKPGGLFCAQNAFAIGSGEQGSMPMHLAVNDRFEKDGDPLLASLGFEQESSNWYRRKADIAVEAAA